MAMNLYACTFKWLINKINQRIKGNDSFSSIGVLDIFGFENFDVSHETAPCAQRGLKEPNVLNRDHLRRAFSVHFEGYGSQQMVSYDPIWTYFGVKYKIRVCLYMGSIIFKLHIYFDYYQGCSDNILCRFFFLKGPRNKQRYRLISHYFVNRLTDLSSLILTMPMRSFSSISTNTSFHWSSLNTTGTCR